MKTHRSSLFLERMRKNRLAHAIGMAMAAIFSLKVAEAEAEDAVVVADADDLKHPSAAALDIGPQPLMAQGDEIGEIVPGIPGRVINESQTIRGETLTGAYYVEGGASVTFQDSTIDGRLGIGSYSYSPDSHQEVTTINTELRGFQPIVMGNSDKLTMLDSTVDAGNIGILVISGGTAEQPATLDLNQTTVTVEATDSANGSGARGLGLQGFWRSDWMPEQAPNIVANVKNSTIVTHNGEVGPEHVEGESWGVYQVGNSELNLQNSEIRATGAVAGNAIGALMMGDATLNALGSTIEGQGNGVQVKYRNTEYPDAARLSVDGSQVTGQEDAGVLVADYGLAEIELRNGGSITGGNGNALEITAGGAASLTVDASHLQGNIASDRATKDGWSAINESGQMEAVSLTSRADVTLQNNAQWTGAAINVDDVNLDATSQWQVTGDSNVGQLATQGTVAFQPGNGYKTLTVEGDLSGQGQFAMNTDIAGRQGDLLVVQGTASGEHQLAIEDSGKQPDHLDALKVVDTQGGPASFNLKGGHVDAGAYRYNLTQSADDWYLAYRDIVPTDPVDPLVPVDPNDPDDPVNPVDPVHPALPDPRPQDLSKGANAALGMQSATSQLFNAEMDSLNQRLGDIRGEKGEGGLWVRGLGKRLEVDSGKSREFDQDIQGVQIGADKAIPLASGKLHLGGMVGASKADMDFGEGAKGKVDATSVGAYGTYLNENGWYVDGVAKIQNFDADVKMPNNLGHSVKGDYSGKGVGVSVEAGKHIRLENGWFVEPQAQLSASRVDGPDYKSSDGMKVDGDAMDSLQGRVGARFGKFIPLDQGRSLQPFVKINQIHEFKGKADVEINDAVTLDNALPGSRTELGVGAQLNLGEKHKVYVEAEAAKGDKVEQPVGVNIGYRYDW
ncbi:autotransporter outer membrane beta-barrel domain-containing protein [Pseudomonas sp. Pseusp97]|uniref:autotransporter outer membrane beta-barrel domain-containing protein n=1 Tax=Pseudomonas sp. Pseusp97 TaxID=3243065 RepID=UPI0039A65258